MTLYCPDCKKPLPEGKKICSCGMPGLEKEVYDKLMRKEAGIDEVEETTTEVDTSVEKTEESADTVSETVNPVISDECTSVSEMEESANDVESNENEDVESVNVEKVETTDVEVEECFECRNEEPVNEETLATPKDSDMECLYDDSFEHEKLFTENPDFYNPDEDLKELEIAEKKERKKSLVKRIAIAVSVAAGVVVAVSVIKKLLKK